MQIHKKQTKVTQITGHHTDESKNHNHSHHDHNVPKTPGFGTSSIQKQTLSDKKVYINARNNLMTAKGL